MTDFGDMIREAMTGGPAFEPEPGRKALETAMERYDRRARTMRWLTAFALLFMTGVTAYGLYQMIHSGGDHPVLLAHGTMLTVVGVSAIGFVKLWFLLTQNHLMVMRELKGLEYLVLRKETEQDL